MRKAQATRLLPRGFSVAINNNWCEYIEHNTANISGLEYALDFTACKYRVAGYTSKEMLNA